MARSFPPKFCTPSAILVCGAMLTTLCLSTIDTVAAQTPPSLSAMSFNIRADFDFGTPTSNANAWISTDGDHRRNLVAWTIQAFDPDLLGVQEAFINQVNDLKTALPGHGFYGIGRNNGLTFGEHSGIYYRSDRFTRTDQGTFWLSNSPQTPSVFPGAATFRIASWVILEDSAANGTEYFVLNTHWDHVSQSARNHSAQLIRSQIDSLAADRPVIVMGDLNATPNNGAFVSLVGGNDPNGLQLQDSYREVFPVVDAEEATFHGFTGRTVGQRIDYVLHDSFFDAESATIDRTSFDGRYPSDHYPVTATLGLPTSVLADFNGDRSLDCLDIDSLIAAIAGGTFEETFDLNGDSVLDISDSDVWLSIATDASSGGTSILMPGDANLDGAVDGADFQVWQQNKFSQIAAWCSGDFNADGAVDGKDFLVWNAHKTIMSAGESSMPVPETTTWAPLIMFLIAGRLRSFIMRANS